MARIRVKSGLKLSKKYKKHRTRVSGEKLFDRESMQEQYERAKKHLDDPKQKRQRPPIGIEDLRDVAVGVPMAAGSAWIAARAGRKIYKAVRRKKIKPVLRGLKEEAVRNLKKSSRLLELAMRRKQKIWSSGRRFRDMYDYDY